MPDHPVLVRARALLPADKDLRRLWVLTIIVVLIVVISCPDVAAVILTAGLLLRLGPLLGPGAIPAATRWAGSVPPSARPVAADAPCAAVGLVAADAERLSPAAVAAEPERPYPGAIDYDPDGPLGPLGADAEWAGADAEWAGAHPPARARSEGPAPEGNPYTASAGRYSTPLAAPACLDDEADASALDGDEKLTYQAFSRNDPLRATMGTMSRRRDLDHYFREEVEDEEAREWWGAHEE